MWNYLAIPLDANGAGNGNINIASAQVLGDVVVPVQDAITSGATELTISHLFPAGVVPAAILTVTNIVTPYDEIPKKLGVGPTNTADTVLGYRMVGSLNVSITSGAANKTAVVLVLLTDG